jgi:hypothetical protein
LYRWRDVPGSKIRATDFIVAAKELFTIWLKYRRNSIPAVAALERGDQAKETRRGV